MISLRVNEIFHYLSTDRKQDQARQIHSTVHDDQTNPLTSPLSKLDKHSTPSSPAPWGSTTPAPWGSTSAPPARSDATWGTGDVLVSKTIAGIKSLHGSDVDMGSFASHFLSSVDDTKDSHTKDSQRNSFRESATDGDTTAVCSSAVQQLPAASSCAIPASHNNRSSSSSNLSSSSSLPSLNIASSISEKKKVEISSKLPSRKKADQFRGMHMMKPSRVTTQPQAPSLSQHSDTRLADSYTVSVKQSRVISSAPPRALTSRLSLALCGQNFTAANLAPRSHPIQSSSQSSAVCSVTESLNSAEKTCHDKSEPSEIQGVLKQRKNKKDNDVQEKQLSSASYTVLQRNAETVVGEKIEKLGKDITSKIENFSSTSIRNKNRASKSSKKENIKEVKNSGDSDCKAECSLGNSSEVLKYKESETRAECSDIDANSSGRELKYQINCDSKIDEVDIFEPVINEKEYNSNENHPYIGPLVVDVDFRQEDLSAAIYPSCMERVEKACSFSSNDSGCFDTFCTCESCDTRDVGCGDVRRVLDQLDKSLTDKMDYRINVMAYPSSMDMKAAGFSKVTQKHLEGLTDLNGTNKCECLADRVKAGGCCRKNSVSSSVQAGDSEKGSPSRLVDEGLEGHGQSVGHDPSVGHGHGPSAKQSLSEQDIYLSSESDDKIAVMEEYILKDSDKTSDVLLDSELQNYTGTVTNSTAESSCTSRAVSSEREITTDKISSTGYDLDVPVCHNADIGANENYNENSKKSKKESRLASNHGKKESENKKKAEPTESAEKKTNGKTNKKKRPNFVPYTKISTVLVSGVASGSRIQCGTVETESVKHNNMNVVLPSVQPIISSTVASPGVRDFTRRFSDVLVSHTTPTSSSPSSPGLRSEASCDFSVPFSQDVLTISDQEPGTRAACYLESITSDDLITDSTDVTGGNDVAQDSGVPVGVESRKTRLPHLYPHNIDLTDLTAHLPLVNCCIQTGVSELDTFDIEDTLAVIALRLRKKRETAERALVGQRSESGSSAGIRSSYELRSDVEKEVNKKPVKSSAADTLDSFEDISELMCSKCRLRGVGCRCCRTAVQQLGLQQIGLQQQVGLQQQIGLQQLNNGADDDTKQSASGCWTEVNRRCRRLMVNETVLMRVFGGVSRLRSVCEVSGATVEVERPTPDSTERTIIIKGTVEQMQSSYNILTSLLNDTDLCDPTDKSSTNSALKNKKPSLPANIMSKLNSSPQDSDNVWYNRLGQCIVLPPTQNFVRKDGEGNTAGLIESEPLRDLVLERNVDREEGMTETHNMREPRQYALFDGIGAGCGEGEGGKVKIDADRFNNVSSSQAISSRQTFVESHRYSSVVKPIEPARYELKQLSRMYDSNKMLNSNSSEPDLTLLAKAPGFRPTDSPGLSAESSPTPPQQGGVSAALPWIRALEGGSGARMGQENLNREPISQVNAGMYSLFNSLRRGSLLGLNSENLVENARRDLRDSELGTMHVSRPMQATTLGVTYSESHGIDRQASMDMGSDIIKKAGIDRLLSEEDCSHIWPSSETHLGRPRYVRAFGEKDGKPEPQFSGMRPNRSDFSGMLEDEIGMRLSGEMLLRKTVGDDIERYSTPDRPMTLPTIIGLNPNAPDFVCTIPNTVLMCGEAEDSSVIDIKEGFGRSNLKLEDIWRLEEAACSGNDITEGGSGRVKNRSSGSVATSGSLPIARVTPIVWNGSKKMKKSHQYDDYGNSRERDSNLAEFNSRIKSSELCNHHSGLVSNVCFPGSQHSHALGRSDCACHGDSLILGSRPPAQKFCIMCLNPSAPQFDNSTAPHSFDSKYHCYGQDRIQPIQRPLNTSGLNRNISAPKNTYVSPGRDFKMVNNGSLSEHVGSGGFHSSDSALRFNQMWNCREVNEGDKNKNFTETISRIESGNKVNMDSLSRSGNLMGEVDWKLSADLPVNLH